MRNLQSLLGRLSQALNRDEDLKKSVISIIKERTSVELPEASIEIRRGEVVVDASPAVKSEVRLKESLILEDIKQRHSLDARMSYR